MIRITITPAAYAAIAATLPSSVGVEQERSRNGDYFIWLAPAVVDRNSTRRAERSRLHRSGAQVAIGR